MSRSAAYSYKGYTFQRARLLNLIFCDYLKNYNEEDHDKIYFQEENKEDIDFYYIDQLNNIKTINYYQEKYLNTGVNESLTESSGLTKVIISHYDNKDVSDIFYEVFTTSENKGKTCVLKNYEKLLKDNDNNN